MNWNCQIFTPQVGTSSPRGRLHSPGGPNPAAGASPRLKPHDPDKTKLKTSDYTETFTDSDDTYRTQ